MTIATIDDSQRRAARVVGLSYLGSTVFCYLWFKSGYIPKALAGLGLLASLVLAACTFAFIIVPELRSIITIGVYGGPIFVFEVTMGAWLLLKGLRRADQLPVAS